MYYYKNGWLIMILFSLLMFGYSCVPIERLSYFNDINTIEKPETNPRIQKVILPFDKIYIKVLSIDLRTSQIFNTTEEIRSGGNDNSGLIGYMVDENGDIYFPFVGKINVGNLTTVQASEKIQKAISDYDSKTSIVVKFVDNQVTILGEVQRQGVYAFTQDKLTIYEALGLGGGLTRFGDRKKVILVRQERDKIMHYRLNLSDSKIAGREYYYILPSDVIIVEPLDAISSSYSNNTYTTILTSLTTLIAVLLFTGVNF